MAITEYHLSDRFLKDDGRVFLTGVQALARLPIEQMRIDKRNGLKTAAFVSGYPGSPLGGFDMELEHCGWRPMSTSYSNRPSTKNSAHRRDGEPTRDRTARRDLRGGPGHLVRQGPGYRPGR